MDENKQPTIAEEAGLPANWIPAENIKPIIPGQFQNSSESTAPFVGSLPPSYQQNVDFAGVSRAGGRGPNLSLMPLGSQGNPSSNAAIISTSTKVVQGKSVELDTNGALNANQGRLNLIGSGVTLTNDGAGNTTITSTSTGDGLIHGNTIWEYDSAYTILRDDFSFGGSGGGSLGDLNWKSSGVNSPSTANYNGAFPYFGQLEIYAGSTAANSLAFITTSAALTGASLVRSSWDAAMPLLDYPGWKMTWVFCIRRQDPHNGGGFPAFSTARMSLYIGLGNGNGSAAATAITLDPRPNVFYGCRFDTDTTAPSIADSTFWLEACSNAINIAATTRYNNQGTNGGVFNTGVAVTEGQFHRLEIVYLSVGQMTITLDGVGTTFTLSQRVASLANNAIGVGNGNSAMPTTISGANSNTNGYIGVAPGSLLTFAGGSLPAAYVGTFPCIQDDGGSLTLITTPAGGGGGVTGAYTMNAYPALYPIASIAVDSTGVSAGIFTRSLVVDYFSLIWNKGLATGAPAPNSTLPRYW